VTDLDALLRRLSEVQDQLLALPDDAFAERYELRRRQDELREEASAFAQDAHAGSSTDDLLTELESLRQQRDAIAAQRIDMVSQSGGGSFTGEGTFGYEDRINRPIMAQADEIVARIGRIKGILIDRGVDIPAP